MPTIAFMALCMEFQNILEVFGMKPLGVNPLSFVLVVLWLGIAATGLTGLMIDIIRRSQELSLQQSSAGANQGIGKSLFFGGGVFIGTLGIVLYPAPTMEVLILLGTVYGAGRMMNRYW